MVWLFAGSATASIAAQAIVLLSYLVASRVMWHMSTQPSPDFVAGVSVYATAFVVFMVPHGLVRRRLGHLGLRRGGVSLALLLRVPEVRNARALVPLRGRRQGETFGDPRRRP